MTTLEIPKPLPAELFCLMTHFLFMLAPSLHESFSSYVFPWIPVLLLVALPLSFALDTLSCDRKELTMDFRPKANPGLWLSLLLPTVFFSVSKVDSPDALKLVALYATPSFVTSAVSISSLVTTFDSAFHLLLFHGVLCEAYVGFLFLFSPAGFLQRLFGDLWILVLFVFLLHATQTVFFASARASLPSTFTVGELSLVSQGLACVLVFLIAVLFCGAPSLYALPVADLICVAITGSLFLFVALVCAFPGLRDPSPFFGWLSSCLLFGLVAILPVRPASWILDDPQRAALSLYCVSVAVVTLCLILSGRWFRSRLSIVVFRKFFHLLVAFVYVPCIMLAQAPFLRLMSTCVLAAFVLVEFVKFFRVAPLAVWLDRRFEALKDSKDVGKVMMSQIYLMIGFLLPLLFAPIEEYDHLEELKVNSGYSLVPLCQWAGVVSLGIGDTFSAVVGSKIGRYKWSETKKTVEGTLAAILAQVAFVGAVHWFAVDGQIDWRVAFAWFLLITANSLLETFTYQVDNLILSLTVIPALMNVNWMRSIVPKS